ncbi:hypothetical protein F442_14589 [Phytophthora nicotianae P10297]|uniref:Uncharacterized protein n=1 Tax=Phytophthora nicotianae P10297 TaxID=1317064 RepID=W2YUJ7_PHYNI|nr:hypothetical protein F442_14589 [Phytophthora nicotianae P10297]
MVAAGELAQLDCGHNELDPPDRRDSFSTANTVSPAQAAEPDSGGSVNRCSSLSTGTGALGGGDGVDTVDTQGAGGKSSSGIDASPELHTGEGCVVSSEVQILFSSASSSIGLSMGSFETDGNNDDFSSVAMRGGSIVLENGAASASSGSITNVNVGTGGTDTGASGSLSMASGISASGSMGDVTGGVNALAMQVLELDPEPALPNCDHHESEYAEEVQSEDMEQVSGGIHDEEEAKNEDNEPESTYIRQPGTSEATSVTTSFADWTGQIRRDEWSDELVNAMLMFNAQLIHSNILQVMSVEASKWPKSRVVCVPIQHDQGVMLVAVVDYKNQRNVYWMDGSIPYSSKEGDEEEDELLKKAEILAVQIGSTVRRPRGQMFYNRVNVSCGGPPDLFLWRNFVGLVANVFVAVYGNNWDLLTLKLVNTKEPTDVFVDNEVELRGQA